MLQLLFGEQNKQSPPTLQCHLAGHAPLLENPGVLEVVMGWVGRLPITRSPRALCCQLCCLLSSECRDRDTKFKDKDPTLLFTCACEWPRGTCVFLDLRRQAQKSLVYSPVPQAARRAELGAPEGSSAAQQRGAYICLTEPRDTAPHEGMASREKIAWSS